MKVKVSLVSVSEFHEYVMPVEHPKLSSFCAELTGIRQQQVDDGLPITTWSVATELRMKINKF